MSVKRVYVGRLSSTTRERDLKDLFTKYGPISKCDLKFGYAFAEFEDAKDAEDAVKYLNGTEFDGSKIIVEFSKGTRKDRDRNSGGDRHGGGLGPQRGEYRLEIEGLSKDVSWQDLKDHFRKAGHVVFADVYPDRGGRGARGVVEYKSKEDMRAALRDFDRGELRGNTIYVREDSDRSPPRKRRSRSNSRSRSRSRTPPRNRRRSRSRSRDRNDRSDRRSRGGDSRSNRRNYKSRSRSVSPPPKRRSPSPDNNKARRSPSPDNNKSKRKSPSPDTNKSRRSSERETSPPPKLKPTNNHSPDASPRTSPSPKRK